ncbi:MAG: hypothetical protein HYY20_14165 [Candidatus Tectomicrobia bacterium]|uniref:Uncharacterized protein n=1 Tax=Tectimicrobiota bacterium TaxID=2528274 RepID=A0A932CR88_UNCTE|nr:hypothetical protein [Candidatus Tectomicrobia bacterium]
MPIPVAEAKAWGVVFAEEFSNAPTPYLGINIFDVPTQHWEAVLQNVRQQVEIVNQVGGKSHLWSVRDHGPRKRVLWVNRYPSSLKELRNFMTEFVEGPMWKEFCSLIDSYQWFLVTEQPSTEP